MNKKEKVFSEIMKIMVDSIEEIEDEFLRSLYIRGCIFALIGLKKWIDKYG